LIQELEATSEFKEFFEKINEDYNKVLPSLESQIKHDAIKKSSGIVEDKKE